MGTSALVAVWQPYREALWHKMPDRPQVFFVFWYFCANTKQKIYYVNKEHQGGSGKYVLVGVAIVSLITNDPRAPKISAQRVPFILWWIPLYFTLMDSREVFMLVWITGHCSDAM